LRADDAAAIIARAQCGAPETQYRAGLILDRGAGVAPDAVGAHAWYAIAASRGFAPAATERDRLAAYLTSDELGEAGRIAAAWPSSACAAEAGG
jgi:TPR repeat protein